LPKSAKVPPSAELAELARLSGVAMHERDYARAVPLLQRATHLAPQLGVLHSNLGEALRRLGRKQEALEAFLRAAQANPEIAEVHYNLALTHDQLGQLAPAIAAYQAALELKPGFPPAALGLLTALRANAEYQRALHWYSAHARDSPDTAELRCAVAAALADVFRIDEAVSHLERALALAPRSAQVHSDYAAALVERGEVDEALALLRRAMELEPENPSHHSKLVYLLPFSDKVEPALILAEARAFGARYAAPPPESVQHENTRDLERKLRVGYVSPDFRMHPAVLFLLPLFRHHDRTRVHVTCYSNVHRPDAVTAELRSLVDEWRDISTLDDERASQLVRHDRIDILVDLAQHSAGNRLLLFAKKPAPVQVAWLGYPGTTGVPAMDYRLTDPGLDPPELGDGYGTETLVWLPDTFWCYAPLSEDPAVSELPALRNGYVTFGSLNSFKKVSDAALHLWAQVLRAVPSSRLVLVAPPGVAHDRVRRVMHEQGVEPERLELVGPMPRPEYLRTYQRVDIGLDPIPYGGGTTSLDAFWMGVPVVTLPGETAVSRAGAAIARNLQLVNLAADSTQQYVAAAASLAGDPRGLAALRGGLRERLRLSPLMDARRFAASLQRIYLDVGRAVP
jgi:protein O-GlcNAc transferase